MIKTCKFCRIISGELLASIVLEDEFCVAFLDSRPLFQGHCLLVPRAHYETLMDLPDCPHPAAFFGRKASVPRGRGKHERGGNFCGDQ